MAQAWREKEDLLRRWLQEKGEVADRLNEYNQTQERWQRLAKPLKKHFHKERRKEDVPMVTSSLSGETQTPSSVIPRITNSKDIFQGHPDHNHI
ncbi:uncharacterized protein ACO6RY_17127 [Pungitius sinensis]